MANWYFKSGDEEAGPVSAADLRRAAAEGRLSPDSPVRREDMGKWIAARRINGLFPDPVADDAALSASTPVDANDGQADAATTVGGDAAAGTPSDDLTHASLKDRVVAKAKATAAIAANQARLKKLGWDRDAIELKIGETAFKERIGAEAYAPLYEQIAAIEAEIRQLREPELTSDEESVGDRTRRLAAEAKKKLQVERKIGQRQQQLRELGRLLRTEQTPEPALATAVANAEQLDVQIASVETEIERLGGSVSPAKGKRQPKATGTRKRRLVPFALLAAGVAAVWFGQGTILPALGLGASETGVANVAAAPNPVDPGDWGFDADGYGGGYGSAAGIDTQPPFDPSAIEAQTAAETTRLQAERAEFERAAKKQAAERAAQQRIDEERQKLAMAKMQAAEEQRAAEQEERDRTARTEAAKRAAADAVRAKATRTALCEKLFSQISLDPAKAIELSTTLKERFGATVELRGRNYAQYQTALQERDWLSLVNLLTGGSYTALPDADTIEQAADTLMRTDLQMLLRTSGSGMASRSYREPTLLTISFPTEYSYRVVQSSDYGWQTHPDGIGYYREWSPEDGFSLVVFANESAIDQRLRSVNERFQSRGSALEQKVQLGELSEAEAAMQLEALRQQIIVEATAWAATL